MKTFKQWLHMMGYDLALKDHLYIKEPSWGKVRNVDIFKLVELYVNDEMKDIRKELSELRAEFILRDEEYINLRGQMQEERNEMHSYIKELRQYED